MKFDVLDQSGQKVQCEVVDLFKDETNKRNYLIYTDGTKNSDGQLEIYASRYVQKNDTFVLEDIEEEQEWDLIDEFLASKR